MLVLRILSRFLGAVLPIGLALEWNGIVLPARDRFSSPSAWEWALLILTALAWSATIAVAMPRSRVGTAGPYWSAPRILCLATSALVIVLGLAFSTVVRQALPLLLACWGAVLLHDLLPARPHEGPAD